jgi:phasin family protein
MSEGSQTIIDMIKKFGTDLKLPSVDMDGVIAHHRKNLEALGQSTKVAAEGAASLAAKQREILEAAMAEMTNLAKGFKMPGTPQEAMTAQTEFAKKAIEAAIQNTKDMAELVQKSNAEALSIIQNRMKESFEEIRSSFMKS